VTFDLVHDWCGAAIHGSERLPRLCVLIGTVPVCEDCVVAYADRWQAMLEEWFLVASHQQDLVRAVESADEIVEGSACS
jgi:hypothetical protein